MSQSDMTIGPISSHIKKIAIPASIGFLFNTLFNVVDTFYAGQLSTDALSGLTLSFPIFFIIISIASGFGNGLSALLANALGKKDIQRFHTYILHAVIFGLIMGVLFITVIPFAIEPYFNATGASNIVKENGISYTQTIFMGGIFFVFNFILNSILQAQGNAKPFRNYLILGFFLNLILDPLFIFGWFGLPEFGTQGVAIATIIVQAIGSVYLIYNVLKSELFNKKLIAFKNLSIKVMRDLILQGLPASLNLAAVAIGIFIINYYVLQYGDELAVAAYGSALRIQQIALLPTIGLNFAIISIVGQNFGADQLDRVYETKNKALKAGLWIAAIGGILVFIFAPSLIAIFNDAPRIIEVGTLYLRIDTIGFLAYVYINIHVSTLQGVKRPSYGLWIALFRQISPIIVFPFLAEVVGLGLSGVFYGIVFVNWIATFIIVYITFHILKKQQQDLFLLQKKTPILASE
jgi:putative MATE family efflux protein